jgi:hypothetical protein
LVREGIGIEKQKTAWHKVRQYTDDRLGYRAFRYPTALPRTLASRVMAAEMRADTAFCQTGADVMGSDVATANDRRGKFVS